MSEQKRILILTADVGFGHRTAANALASALREMYGEECVVEIANPLDDERTPGFLRDAQTDYDRMVRESPEVYRIRYQISDAPVSNAIFENLMTVFLFKVVRDAILQFHPDVIVTTHPMYPGPVKAVKAISDLDVPFVIVVTDLVDVHASWFNDSADLFLVPTKYARDQALEIYPPEKVLVTGIPVNPRFAQEKRPAAVLRKELGWDPDLRTVLVVGSRRVNNLEDNLHVLNHAALPMQLVLVAGGDDELYQRFQQEEWHGKTHLYNFVKNMPAMMRAADCVISKAGGLIVTESLACGLPMLFVDVTPGQEVGNAMYMIKNGAGEWPKTPVEMLETLFHWLYNDGEVLRQFQRKARALGRPLSAFTVASMVWSAAERGPIPFDDDHVPVLPKLLDFFSSTGLNEDRESSSSEDHLTAS